MDILQALKNKGWYVFPVKGKIPALKGDWREHSTNKEETIFEWSMDGYNGFGVDLEKSGLTVIDIDIRPGKSGFDSLKSLNISLPKTFTVSTPTGGKHLYYKGVTKSGKLRLNGETVDGVDVKSGGGYVVAPSSPHPAGGFYEIEDDDVIVFLPKEIAEQGLASAKSPDRDKPIIELDKITSVAECIKYLLAEEPAVSGDNGNTHTYKVVCRVRDFGLSKEIALKVLLENWNEHCCPPWSEYQLEGIVKNAYSYAGGVPGAKTKEGKALIIQKKAEEAFEPIPEPESLLPKVINLLDMKGKKAPERDWLIDEWLPRGYEAPTLFTGDGGTGKTLLAMQMAIALGSGTPWLGLTPKRRVRSILLMCEDGADEVHRRSESIQLAFQDIPDDAEVFFVPLIGRNCVICMEKDGSLRDGPFLSTLKETLNEAFVDIKEGHPKESVIFVDTASDVFSGNESNRTGVNQFVKNKFCALMKSLNATGIMLAHPPKADGATYSGSTAWNNSFRNRLFLDWFTPGKKDKFRVLSREKSNYAEAGAKIPMKYAAGCFIRIDEAEASIMNERAVYEAIISAEDLGTQLTLSHQSGTRYIGNHVIKDAEGSLLTKSLILESVEKLIAKGYIENRTEGTNKGLFMLSEMEKF